MDNQDERGPRLRPTSQAPVASGRSGEFDFFLSYSRPDHAWAEWIAWNLEEAGHSTILQAWDCLPGMDFVEFMLHARTHSKKTIAVLSDDYFGSDHCMTEYKDSYAADPSGQMRLLVPIRVVDCTPTLLQTWVYSDMFGRSEVEARAALVDLFGTNLEAKGNLVNQTGTRDRRKPGAEPSFPGGLEATPGVEQDPLIPKPVDDREFKILLRRLLKSSAVLFAIGTLSVSLAYLLGSQLFQDSPKHAYWDRMFNFMGDPEKRSSFGFGPGYLIEVFRMMILLILPFLVMPTTSFKEVACRLILESPARRLFGFGKRDEADSGETSVDTWVGLLVCAFLCVGCFAIVGGFCLTQGPQELWKTEGAREKGPIRSISPGNDAPPPRDAPDTKAEGTQPLPKFSDPEYRRRCWTPYLIYSVYSLINYVIGANLVVTMSVFAVITDLLWMYRWTSGFELSCTQGLDSPERLHRLYRSHFLARLKKVLERYYSLLVFLLLGFSFKVWFDRINLSPSAYEIELFALYVATIPLVASFLLSGMFYKGALESAASRAQDPDLFRRNHRIEDFYRGSFRHSIYRPIAMVLMASLVVYLLARLTGLAVVI